MDVRTGLGFLPSVDFAQEDLCEDVCLLNRLGSAVVDDAPQVQHVGPVDDVQHSLNVVLDDQDGGTEPFADLGDLLKYLLDHYGREAKGGVRREAAPPGRP